MAKIADISVADAPPAGAVQLLVRGDTVALPLKGIVDLAAETARLEKDQAKAEAEINRIDAKLANPDFIARAREEVVEADREKREEAGIRRAKIVEALERLKQME
jgi:valyl-tRNA synthetase